MSDPSPRFVRREARRTAIAAQCAGDAKSSQSGVRQAQRLVKRSPRKRWRGGPPRPGQHRLWPNLADCSHAFSRRGVRSKGSAERRRSTGRDTRTTPHSGSERSYAHGRVRKPLASCAPTVARHTRRGATGRSRPQSSRPCSPLHTPAHTASPHYARDRRHSTTSSRLQRVESMRDATPSCAATHAIRGSTREPL